MKEAVQQPPAMSGLELANWYWKVVRQFVSEHFGVSMSRSSCLNYLHRLGFAFRRPEKWLVKADEAKREAFVVEYAALSEEACQSNAKTFFADEAHFRADAELRGKWVLRGEPALVDSSSPRCGEKASYYSAVCQETGEVEWMELEGNSNSETSAKFLGGLRESHGGRLNVIWDNAPAHRGEAVREYLRTPGLNLRLMNLPGYSPDLNADEAIWGWRERRPPGTCAWGPKPWCRRKSEASWRGWPDGKRRSSAAAAPSCNQGLKGYCKTPSPTASHMHIPPWLWFRNLPSSRLSLICWLGFTNANALLAIRCLRVRNTEAPSGYSLISKNIFYQHRR